MAEITNEIDWLKACNHLVLENYADAEAWGWDGCGGIEPSDVELEAKHLWRLGWPEAGHWPEHLLPSAIPLRDERLRHRREIQGDVPQGG